jgi:hypothetical protein
VLVSMSWGGRVDDGCKRLARSTVNRQLARLLRRGTSRSEKATGDHSRRSRRAGISSYQ